MDHRSAKLACAAALLAATCASTATTAQAQGWKPERPVEIVVGSTPGGALDRTGRLLQRVVQERKLIDQPVNLLNKPGGSGTVGLTYLAQHPGDAHYVMITGQALLTNHIMGRATITYTDFTPLGILNAEYVALSVRAESPVKSAKEFMERMKKDPAAYSVAVGTGFGSATHMSYAHAMFVSGVEVKKMRQVTFGSGGESMTALLGGHVDATSSPVSSIVEQQRAGRIRVLAVSAPRRLGGALAGVPTWTELDVKSSIDVWRALAAPKGLNAAQIAWWDAVLARVVKDREWEKELERTSSELAYRDSAATLKHWQREYAEMKALYGELGLAKQ